MRWMIKTLGVAIGAVLFVGCGSAANVDPGSSDDGGPPQDTAPAVPTCSPSVSFDPKAGNFAELRSVKPLHLPLLLSDSGTTKGTHPLKVVLLLDGKEVKTLFDLPSAESLSKDGKTLGATSIAFLATSLAAPAPGKYTLRATLSCPNDAPDGKPTTQETTIWIARIGARAVSVGKGDGGKVPLMYHMADHGFKNYYPIPDAAPAASLIKTDGKPELDDDNGVPLFFPDLWTDLDTPQVDKVGAVMDSGSTLPTSLVLGTKPDLIFTMGKTTAGARSTDPPVSAGLDLVGLPTIRMVLDGTTATGDGSIGTDGTTTFRLTISPVPAIDRVDLKVAWHFESKNAVGDFVAIPGATQSATFRVYGVLGNTQGASSPQLPWVALVDEATHAIGGKATDADGARSILVKHVFKEMGLAYDRRSGASAYTYSTSADGFTNDVFALSSFTKRSYGNIVNCSDCGSILSTYANMIGAELHYCIIGWDFSLNPIEGIGSTTFGSPFDSGRFGFRYHAVTSPDKSAHIFDATLAVDGDSDPTDSTYTEQLVQGLTGDDYLHRLSPGTPAWKYVDQTTTVK